MHCKGTNAMLTGSSCPSISEITAQHYIKEMDRIALLVSLQYPLRIREAAAVILTKYPRPELQRRQCRTIDRQTSSCSRNALHERRLLTFWTFLRPCASHGKRTNAIFGQSSKEYAIKDIFIAGAGV